MTPSVRRIGPEDAEAYRAIRLAALDGDPASFSSDLATERAHPLAWYADGTTENAIFLAFDGTTPVGMAGLAGSEREKTSHIGVVFGVYVVPSCRRKGVAALLMQTVIAHAQPTLLQLHLGVAVDNIAALALYHRLGFAAYGTEPRALRIKERFIDEHLMVRFLDEEEIQND